MNQRLPIPLIAALVVLPSYREKDTGLVSENQDKGRQQGEPADQLNPQPPLTLNRGAECPSEYALSAPA